MTLNDKVKILGFKMNNEKALPVFNNAYKLREKCKKEESQCNKSIRGFINTPFVNLKYLIIRHKKLSSLYNGASYDYVCGYSFYTKSSVNSFNRYKYFVCKINTIEYVARNNNYSADYYELY